MDIKTRNRRKSFSGVVISTAPEKTVMVSITWKEKDSIYGKYIRKETKIMAHDENNECKKGDKVFIVQTKPISKRKHFRVATPPKKA
ncbi:MAG: 30S ribosomal protein S17 [Cytophagales bacterium]